MLYIASSLHFKLHLFEISDVMKSVMSIDEHILSHLDLIFVVIQSVISFGVLVEAHFSLMYSLTLFCIMSLRFFCHVRDFDCDVFFDFIAFSSEFSVDLRFR